jgi:hypothetical protein
MEAPIKSEAGYNQATDLQTLYNSNRNNLMDIVNFEEEISMYKEILQTKFNDKIKDENVNRIQLLDMQLNQVKYIKNNTKENILRHNDNLEANKSEYFLKLEHERVKDELANLGKRLSSLKDEIYRVSTSTADVV